VSSVRRASASTCAEMPRPAVLRWAPAASSGSARGRLEVTAAHAATRMSQEGIDGWAAAGHPDAVVVGLDPQLTYMRIAAAADCVRAGSALVATNRDAMYPTERGFRPGRARSSPRWRWPRAHRSGHHQQARALLVAALSWRRTSGAR
jgi:hypothetical protein